MTKSTHPTPLDEEKLVEELAKQIQRDICLRQASDFFVLCRTISNYFQSLIPLIRSDERSKAILSERERCAKKLDDAIQEILGNAATDDDYKPFAESHCFWLTKIAAAIRDSKE